MIDFFSKFIRFLTIMPILNYDFIPSLPFRNGHFNTVYRAVFAKDFHDYTRERVLTWDNDFIDLDFSRVGSKILTILIHGLEGSSESNYMITTTNSLNIAGIDTVCMNLRGCSGEDNWILPTYHSGKTDDLDFIIKHITQKYTYEHIIICGFSLGGNMTLKYLGEYDDIPKQIKGGIAISVPIDITTAQAELSKLKNKLYMTEFLRTMKLKMLEKAEKFPDFKLDKRLLFKATKFRHIEKQYTVPVFGFESSEDYWKKASCKPYIEKIQHKSLLVNAKDDSFLSKECYPFDIARKSDKFYFNAPTYGGHVGFISSFTEDKKWIEQQILNFITEHLL